MRKNTEDRQGLAPVTKKKKKKLDVTREGL